METFLSILHVVVAILLMVVVLIQGGENVDIAAAFGGVSQAAFGPRGTVTTLQKITWVLAIIFMLTSLSLAVISRKANAGSLFQNAPAKSAPASPAPSK